MCTRYRDFKSPAQIQVLTADLPEGHEFRSRQSRADFAYVISVQRRRADTIQYKAIFAQRGVGVWRLAFQSFVLFNDGPI
jgi:hypothetical protein